MKLNKISRQLIIGVLLGSFSNQVNCRNWFKSVVGTVFDVGLGAFNTVGFVATNAINTFDPIINPIFDTFDYLAEEAVMGAIRLISERGRASERGYNTEEILEEKFGNGWDNLVTSGHKLDINLDNVVDNGLSLEIDPIDAERMQIAKSIDDEIAQLNKDYGKTANSYPKGVFAKVQQIMEMINSPDFRADNVQLMDNIKKHLDEIKAIYARPDLEEVKGNQQGANSKKTFLPELDLLIDEMETKGYTDKFSVGELMKGFVNRRYKCKNGKFDIEIEPLIYQMDMYIEIGGFDFFNDDCIRELVNYIREIEKIFFNLPENVAIKRRSLPFKPQGDYQENSSTLVLSSEAELTINSLHNMKNPMSLIKLYLQSYYDVPGTSDYYEPLKDQIDLIIQLAQLNVENVSDPQFLHQLKSEFAKLEALYWKNLKDFTIFSGPKLGPGYSIYVKPGSFPEITSIKFVDVHKETKGFLTYLHMGKYPPGKEFCSVIYDYLQTHYTNPAGEFDSAIQPFIDSIKHWANNPNSNPSNVKSLESLVKLFYKLEVKFFKKDEQAAGETIKFETKHKASQKNIFGVTIDFVQGLIDCIV